MFYPGLQVEFGNESLAKVSPVASRMSPSPSYSDSIGNLFDFFKTSVSNTFLWMWQVTPGFYPCTSTILLAITVYLCHNLCDCRSQWPWDVRCGVCGRSPAGIAGSNPFGDMNVCYLWMLCLLSGRGLCDGSIAWPEESSRMWCFWIWSRNIKDEPEIPSKSAIKCVKINLRTFRTTNISLIFDE
jgi:hypothetical protein